LRPPALARHIHSLRPADFTTITLDRADSFGQLARPACTRNADLDIMLAVLAQALLAALRTRLPGYHAATPDTIQRRFLETPGQIITPTRHHRPLVGQPNPALRTRLNLAPNRLRGNPH
jgi:hypothetical protein